MYIRAFENNTYRISENKDSFLLLKEHENKYIKAQQNFGYSYNLILKGYQEQLQLKRYSAHTIEIYCNYFKQFIYENIENQIEKFSYYQIYDYVLQKYNQNKFSEQQIRQLISSIKFFYEQILGYEKLYFKLSNDYEIKHVPTILEFDKIVLLLKKIGSYHDKLLIFIAYYIGLDSRYISKLTLQETKKQAENLKINNNFAAFAVFKELIKNYYSDFKPRKYLFEKENSVNFSAKEIKTKVYNALSDYQLHEIYRQQFYNAVAQTNFVYQTKKNYTSTFLNFLNFFDYRHPSLISDEEIRAYVKFLCNFSEYAQNNAINSIKFYYTNILGRKIDRKILVRPKKSDYLPTVLSLEELNLIINNIENIKHRCIISLIYSAGLRRSELQNLTLKDIDSKRKVININRAKGKKDRITMLSANMLQMLREYYREYKPKDLLFEGIGGQKYSATSMSNILKRAAEKAGIRKRVYLHLLRHSFATHLIEQGTDIRFIQQILGHNDIKTTTRYTHIANKQIVEIHNPFDTIARNEEKSSND